MAVKTLLLTSEENPLEYLKHDKNNQPSTKNNVTWVHVNSDTLYEYRVHVNSGTLLYEYIKILTHLYEYMYILAHCCMNTFVHVNSGTLYEYM